MNLPIGKGIASSIAKANKTLLVILKPLRSFKTPELWRSSCRKTRFFEFI